LGAAVGSDRHPAADDATGKSFEGDGRGASFASRKNREIKRSRRDSVTGGVSVSGGEFFRR